MEKQTESIQVIEDEPDLRDGLKHNLELENYVVDTAATGTPVVSWRHSLRNST